MLGFHISDWFAALAHCGVERSVRFLCRIRVQMLESNIGIKVLHGVNNNPRNSSCRWLASPPWFWFFVEVRLKLGNLVVLSYWSKLQDRG